MTTKRTRSFQFHSGSIKTDNTGEVAPQMKEFQFHSGSIKTGWLAVNGVKKTSFNSTLVRLRRMEGTLQDPHHPRFNSTLVRLRPRPDVHPVVIRHVSIPLWFD